MNISYTGNEWVKKHFPSLQLRAMYQKN